MAAETCIPAGLVVPWPTKGSLSYGRTCLQEGLEGVCWCRLNVLGSSLLCAMEEGIQCPWAQGWMGRFMDEWPFVLQVHKESRPQPP